MSKKFLLFGLCLLFLLVTGCSRDTTVIPLVVSSNSSGGDTVYVNTTMNSSQIQDLGFDNRSQDLVSDVLNMNYKYGCQRNGTYCDGLMGNTARTIATAYTSNVLRCFPYVVGKAHKIDQLIVITGTANITHNATVKIALYSDNGFGYPNRLLVNTSPILYTASTGVKSQNIDIYQLSNNTLYWMCSAFNGTTTTARVNVAPVSDYPNILGLSSGTAGNIGYTVAFTFTNAFPDPYTAGATYVTAIYPSAYTRVRTD